MQLFSRRENGCACKRDPYEKLAMHGLNVSRGVVSVHYKMLSMKEFGQALRRRAGEIGLSDAEVARRVGLDAGRYGNYVRGTREPDFRTFEKICRVLLTTPNALLGFDEDAPADHSRAMAALNALDENQRRLAVEILETMVRYQVTREE